MQPATKHIILLCDKNEHAMSWLDLFKEIQAPVDLQVANSLKHLLLLIEKKLPDIIILFLSKPDNSVITYLKDLRNKDGDIDEIPIFIYTVSPKKEDVEELLKTVDSEIRIVNRES